MSLRVVVMLLACAGLAGCATEPEPGPGGVVIRHNGPLGGFERFSQ